MSIRIPALMLGLFLLIALTGCTGDSVPEVIPTVAALPTSTATATATATNTPLPPTWTPLPTDPPNCGEVIAATARTASTICGANGIGSACLVSAPAYLTQASGEALTFAEPGTTVPVNSFQRIDTAAYDSDSSKWGMATLIIDTTAPDGGIGSAVTAILFGEAALFNAGGGADGFQQIYLHSGWVDTGCDLAPLPGVLFQSASGPAWLTINGLPVQFDGTLLVRAQASDQMRINVLRGVAQATLTDDTLLEAPEGGTIQTPLGGDNGYITTGTVTLQALETDQMTYLPLASLPRAVAVAPPLRATAEATEVPSFGQTPTTVAPFSGTPPGGIYLTYGGDTITPGNTVTGTVPEGGSAIWSFTPSGLAPDSVDSFEIEALDGNWDPVITLESATWGVYIENYNQSNGTAESYLGSLAGSGGGWRIIITGAGGGGGPYRLSYDCYGPCPAVE